MQPYHCHLVETGLTLPLMLPFPTLSSLMPSKLLSILLSNAHWFTFKKLQFKPLFGTWPNYHKHCQFECIYFSFTVPYNSNKLQSKFVPSAFLGYSQLKYLHFMRPYPLDACISMCSLRRLDFFFFFWVKPNPI